MALTDNLQAFYKLSDTSDSSGNGRTLTNNGNVSFASGKIGNAAVFNGSNQLQVTNPISEGAEYSIAGWVNFANFDSLQYVFSFGNDMGVLYHNGVSPAEVIITPQVGSYVGAGTPSANEWHFIYAYRKSDGEYGISIDNGSLITGNAGETYYGTFQIGHLLNGLMDAVGIWNRALTTQEISELYNSGTGLELTVTPSVNLNSGLQAFYKLDDTSDSSGNGNTLTNSGGVTFASGKIGNAAVFDGSNYLTIPSSPSLVLADTSWNISLWVNFNTVAGGEQNIIESFTPPAGPGWTLYLINGNIEFYTGSEPITTVSVQANQWYNIVVNRNDQGDLKIFINGNLEYTGSHNVTSFEGDWVIGSRGTDSSFLNGSMDAVGIWNRALSDAEIAALYNNGAGLEVEVPPPPYTIRIAGNAKFQGKVKFA